MNNNLLSQEVKELLNNFSPDQANKVNAIKYSLHINKLLKVFKNKWLFDIDSINKKVIELKCYNNYLQVFKIAGVDYGGSNFNTKKELLEYIYTSIYEFNY